MWRGREFQVVGAATAKLQEPIMVSKMTSHCMGTVQNMREESESGIRKWEEMWFKMTAEDGERGGSSDMWWKTVPQASCCDRKRSVTEVDRRVRRTSWDVDEAERSHCMASIVCVCDEISSLNWFNADINWCLLSSASELCDENVLLHKSKQLFRRGKIIVFYWCTL